MRGRILKGTNGSPWLSAATDGVTRFTPERIDDCVVNQGAGATVGGPITRAPLPMRPETGCYTSRRSQNMPTFLIRPAVVAEKKALEDLQWRASLTNAGDRDALLA